MRSLLCFLMLLWFLPGHAQQAWLEGKVIDSRSMEPLPGATIRVGDKSIVSTSHDGLFLVSVPVGSLVLTFQYVGYNTLRKELLVAEGDRLILEILMDPAVTEMDQVVVSASRVAQRIAESMVSLGVISLDQMHETNQTDPRRILNRMAGVEVMDGQVSVRGGSGFSYGAGSRVLVMVDGLPALTPDAGSVRWQALPLENMSQIEIIKGASSVLYGSSALNGVVNFRSAPATPEGNTSFYAESTVFDTPRNREWKWWDKSPMAYRASFSHQKKYGQTSLSIGGFGMLDNGYRKLNDEMLFRANARLARNHSRIQGLEYGLALYGGTTLKHDFLLWENAWDGALRQNPETADRLRGWFFYTDTFIGYKSTAATVHTWRNRLQMSDNTFANDDKNNSKTRAVYSEYHVVMPLSYRVDLNAGFSTDFREIRSPFYGDHTGVNMAVFTQAEWAFSQSLSLVAGVRTEFNALDGEHEKLIPLFRTGLLYKLDDKTFIRSSFGQGYRYPSVAEKFAATTVGAVRIIPNPAILPESGWNAEVGIKRGFWSEKIDGLADLAVFYGQNKDMIEFVFGVYRNPLTGQFETGFRATNIEFSRVYGIELDVRANFRTRRFGHAVTGGYVMMHPVELDPFSGKETGEYLKFRRKNAVSVSWRISLDRFVLQLDSWYRSRILAIDEVFLHPATREQVLPGFFNYWTEHNKGYILMNISMGYGLNAWLNVSLSANNLTNTEYMGRPGDIQPHRHLSVRLTADM